MRRLTERAVDMADISLFLIDGRVGVTPSDETFAEILRKKGAKVILGVNKAEGKAGDAGALEGLEPWSRRADPPVGPEHGEGIDDLYNALKPYEHLRRPRRADAPVVDVDISEEEAEEEVDEKSFAPTLEHPLQIAVIGRPNAGKSTLINTILALTAC